MHLVQLHDVVIVMGMMRSGTTLLAEMVHRGGTPMFVESEVEDASYDRGIKYERPLTHSINLEILGLLDKPFTPGIDVANLPLGPLPQDALERLDQEVSGARWGFKDPRTTVAYPVWSQAFPRGPRLYSYRSHMEVMQFYFKRGRTKRGRFKNARKALYAWIVFNEQLLRNLESDRTAGRPAVLVNYAELMSEPKLVEQMSKELGLPLFDARDPNLRRNVLTSFKSRLGYHLLSLGYIGRIAKLYRGLEAARLKVE